MRRWIGNAATTRQGFALLDVAAYHAQAIAPKPANDGFYIVSEIVFSLNFL
jgi:hypothetical protein